MDIQARLYWRIIRDSMDRDHYFKDFRLADYRFIVVNRKTLVPLIWELNSTSKIGEIILKDTVLRDPVVVGKELRNYLDNRPVVPDGIELVKPNILDNWI